MGYIEPNLLPVQEIVYKARLHSKRYRSIKASLAEFLGSAQFR